MHGAQLEDPVALVAPRVRRAGPDCGASGHAPSQGEGGTHRWSRAHVALILQRSVVLPPHPTYLYYDGAGRQKGTRDALGGHTYYEFDERGWRTEQVDHRGFHTYYYHDKTGGQKGTKDTLGGHSYFGFDAAGNQIETVDARRFHSYFYYDELNRQKGTKDTLGGHAYHEFDAAGKHI